VYDEITGGSDFIQLGEHQKVSLQRPSVVHELGLEDRITDSLFFIFFHLKIFL
jgi:hypothetical protein